MGAAVCAGRTGALDLSQDFTATQQGKLAENLGGQGFLRSLALGSSGGYAPHKLSAHIFLCVQ